MPTQKTTVELTAEQIAALRALFAHIIEAEKEQQKKAPPKKRKGKFDDEIDETFKRKYPFS